MGRYDYSNKTEVEDTIIISASFLKKHNYFCGYKGGTITWTRSGAWGERKSSVGVTVTINDVNQQLKINYTQTDRDTNEKKDFDYKIPLTSTPCKYGGKRWWFICPWYKNGVYCGKRVGNLYKDGDYFACRHCYNLTYKSKKQNRKYKYFPLFNVFDIDEKIQELEPKIKKRTYKGKATKKYRKLLKLYHQAEQNEGNFSKIAELIRK